ncbi:ABC transporter substrate-binding protein [Herbiconiux liukaitaii]|uniref:ABC transporter substrate-binding protein n=1 Tax=Herbiconiux liukaitaii TaxID=3342799 RepID=UPI0035BA15D1
MAQQRRSRVLRTSMVATTAAAALILSGCSGSGDSAETDGNSFTFTFATSNNLESPYETLAKDYMAENEGVEITTNPTPNDKYGETIRTQLSAGNASDVIQTTPGSGDARGLIPLAEAGFLAPLGDTAAGLIPEGSESVFEYEGEVYGQPLDFTIGSIVASMGTAAQAGITEFPTSMDDLYTECTDLTAAGKSMFAVAGAAGPNAGLTAQAISASRVYAETPDWNQQRADGEVTFADTEGWKDTLQTIIDLNEGGCFQPGVEGGGFDAITNGLAGGTSIGGFIPSGSAVEIATAAPPEADFKIQAFPAPDGGTPYILASSNYTMSLNAKSADNTAAKDFLDWLATPEAQQKYFEYSGELPISAYQDMDLSDTVYSDVVDLLADGSYAPLPANVWPNPSVYAALQTGVQGLLTGQNTVDQVLASMDAAWDE